jgi:hypothetical protein
MTSTVDDQVKHHKMRFLASVLCIDDFTITSRRRYDYCITQRWKKETIANAEELCRNGTIAEAACISSIGEAIAAEKPYEEVLNEIQRVLGAFTSLRMHMALELDQILALCCFTLIRDEIQQDVPRSDQRDQVAILKTRYITHVNNASWSPARFANIQWRIKDLCEHMKKKYICCIPVLTEDGVRNMCHWQPYFDTKHFVIMANLTCDRVFCRDMMSAICIIESFENELRDILDEVRAWKALQCALALHRRLGRNSLLGSVGDDVVRVILKFVLD